MISRMLSSNIINPEVFDARQLSKHDRDVIPVCLLRNPYAKRVHLLGLQNNFCNHL